MCYEGGQLLVWDLEILELHYVYSPHLYFSQNYSRFSYYEI